jgi:myosin-5
MSETTNIWVKTSLLEKAITGKASKEIRRGLPSENREDEHIDWGWVYATLINRDDQSIEIFIQDEDSPHHGETTKLPADSFQKGNLLMGNKYKDDEEFDEDGEEEANYPDDLITLTHLHEPEVVLCLRQRYIFDKIYTNTGPILLALNPFKNCKQLYSRKVMEEYWARGEQLSKGIVDDENPLPPHVYGIADRSFRIMMQTIEDGKSAAAKRSKSGVLTDQSILVSGESGAGKTVTTKFIMQYLATLSQKSAAVDETKLEKSGGQTIEQQVLQSNPILESFGNARTIRNDNSSRFGKFIELKFNAGALVGASVQTYLLEKVRLISQAEGERNYHIFYELFCMGDEDLENFHLEIYNPEDFNMTNRSGTFDRRDGIEDFETFDDLKKAMNILGMTAEEQNNVFTIPAAALHASNITFLATSNDESELDASNPHLEPFLKLMGLSKDDLQQSLCYLQIKAGREIHNRTLSKAKAEKGLEAFIKAFYGALFLFLVKRINSSITVKDTSRVRRKPVAKGPDEATIGVLDIFGFESFKRNSFEQLCINYCNEALQQQFNLFVLKNEQAEYEKEGIAWNFITFPDNQDVLDLIDKKGCGILNILDDQCRAPGTTDKTFCIDLYNKCTGHSRFEADFRQVGAQLFGVNHYAGPVEYNTAGFVEKNKDDLPKEATDLLFSSTKEIVQEIATILSDPNAGGADARAHSISPTRPGAKSVKLTVGSQFSRQLRDLRAKIDLTSPHYVRCLKPNDLLVPDHFNPLIISDQLRYAGVIEAVRVSRVGYPHRYTHNVFNARYRILALAELKKAQRSSKRSKPINVVVQAIAEKIWKVQCEQGVAEGKSGDEEKKEDDPVSLIAVGVQVGKTKVFLRRGAYEILEQLRSGKNGESAILIQKVGRGYIDRRSFNQFRSGMIAIQCLARMQTAKLVVHEKRLNYRATRIQTLWRKGTQHTQYAVALAVAKWMQRVQRGRNARCKYEELNRVRKAEVIQRYSRKFSAQKQFQTTMSAILTIQCATRCRFARVVFKGLKSQSRDLNSAVTERDTFRKEVQKLRLQLKEANAQISNAEANASSGVAVEELEAAQSKIKELSTEIDELRKALAKAKEEKEEQEKLVVAAKASVKESEGKADEQLTRAERYKKRFIEDHEEVKRLKEEKEKSGKEMGEMIAKLDASEAAAKEGAQSRKVDEELKKELTKAQEELHVATEESARISGALDQMTMERDGLLKETESLSAAQQNMAPTVSTAELDAANATILELKEQLAMCTTDQEEPSEELEAVKKELAEVEIQARDDLHRKNKVIENLKKDRDAALVLQSRSVSPKGGESNEEVLSLRDEVIDLKKELMEARKTQTAGEFDPNSPAALAQRYEELRRLAEAGMEKDHEIEKLKALIEELDSDDAPPIELSNNEEVMTLRTYIHELQNEIANLREDIDNASEANRSVAPRRSSLLSIIMSGSEHGKRSQPQDTEVEEDVEARINELEDEVEALKEVNKMLRTEIEKSRKKLKDLEGDLQEEKDIARRELESFARTLQGVDELRKTAENMSRQVNQYKSNTPLPRSLSAGRGFPDEVVEDFDDQFKESVDMIEAARVNFEHDAAEKSEKKPKSNGFWNHLLSGTKAKDTSDIGKDEDQLDEHVLKLMAATKQRRKKKKKRRGSGNSIFSSFN